MVERYNYCEGDEDMCEDIHGAYVGYDDYDALEAKNARLKEALRECMEAIFALGGIVAEVEDACSNWHEHAHVGSRMVMFRIAHAVETPEASVAIAKAVVVGKKAREVLGDGKEEARS